MCQHVRISQEHNIYGEMGSPTKPALKRSIRVIEFTRGGRVSVKQKEFSFHHKSLYETPFTLHFFCLGKKAANGNFYPETATRVAPGYVMAVFLLRKALHSEFNVTWSN